MYVDESVCGRREVKKGQQIFRSAIIGNCEDPILMQVTKLHSSERAVSALYHLANSSAPINTFKKGPPILYPEENAHVFKNAPEHTHVNLHTNSTNMLTQNTELHSCFFFREQLGKVYF